MRGYYIDGRSLPHSDRLFIDQQIGRLGYVYNPVKGLEDFTFYAKDFVRFSEVLRLPVGCKLTEIQAVP